MKDMKNKGKKNNKKKDNHNNLVGVVVALFAIVQCLENVDVPMDLVEMVGLMVVLVVVVLCQTINRFNVKDVFLESKEKDVSLGEKHNSNNIINNIILKNNIVLIKISRGQCVVDELEAEDFNLFIVMNVLLTMMENHSEKVVSLEAIRREVDFLEAIHKEVDFLEVIHREKVDLLELNRSEDAFLVEIHIKRDVSKEEIHNEDSVKDVLSEESHSEKNAFLVEIRNNTRSNNSITSHCLIKISKGQCVEDAGEVVDLGVAATEVVSTKKRILNLLWHLHNNNIINLHLLIIKPQCVEDEVEEVDLGVAANAVTFKVRCLPEQHLYLNSKECHNMVEITVITII